MAVKLKKVAKKVPKKRVKKAVLAPVYIPVSPPKMGFLERFRAFFTNWKN